MHDPLYIGLDGARGGWVAVLWRPDANILDTRRLDALTELPRLAPAHACIDMPLGLMDTARPGGRPCDQEGRRLLRAMGGRAASIFSPPCRSALSAPTHAEATARNRASGPQAPGLSLQAFNLFPLLRQVEALASPEVQRWLVEAHPELAFARLNGGTALPSKKTAEGRTARLALLRRAGLPPLDVVPARLKAAWDDVLDAAVLAWLAGERAAGRALRTPQAPDTDVRGLRMEIWY